jgi:hypothetical protein
VGSKVEVFLEGGLDEGWLLVDHREGLSESLHREGLNGATVKQDAASRDLSDAEESVDDCSLAGTRPPHNADLLAGPDAAADALYDIGEILPVPNLEIPELDISRLDHRLHFLLNCLPVLAVFDIPFLRFDFHEFVDSFYGD